MTLAKICAICKLNGMVNESILFPYPHFNYFVPIPTHRLLCFGASLGIFNLLLCSSTNFILYFIRTEIFASKFALWKSVSDFTSTNQRGETSFSHVKKSFRPITNHGLSELCVSRAFSRSSRVALSGSFDKILYFRCTRVVCNSNLSRARRYFWGWLNNQEDLCL